MVRWSISKNFNKLEDKDILDIKCDILRRLHIRKLIYNEVNFINNDGEQKQRNWKTYNEVKETLLKEMEGEG